MRSCCTLLYQSPPPVEPDGINFSSPNGLEGRDWWRSQAYEGTRTVALHVVPFRSRLAVRISWDYKEKGVYVSGSACVSSNYDQKVARGDETYYTQSIRQFTAIHNLL